MRTQESIVSVSKLFEERTKEIDAARRSAQEVIAPDVTTANEPLRYHVIGAEGRPSYIVELQGKTLVRSLAADSPEGQDILARGEAVSLALPDPQAAPPETETQLDQTLASTQELAAVSGRVDPNELTEEIPDEIRPAVLNRLAPQCTIETHQGKVQWLLSKSVRSTALRRLIETERLQRLLNSPLPDTDTFGEMLRALLRYGDTLKLEELDRDELLALTAAMEATEDSGLPKPAAIEVRRRLGSPKFLSEYDVLLERGFVGRRQELDALNKFLSDPAGSTQPGSWSNLVLTGIGGSGKSTLLAKFARDVFKENRATVAILDFDRPGIDAHDFYWMEQEISRQVGHQYPEQNEFLRSRRFEERRHRSEYVDSVRQASADVTEEERSSRSIMSDVAFALTSADANNRPFLLVLDTYEQIEEQDLSVKVFDWLYDIATYLQQTPLKVIFSGRLYDSSLNLLKQQSQSTVIDVAELDPADAQQLLLQNGIPAPTAERLVQSEVLPLRPLELTLLARVTIDLDKTIDELEVELKEGGKSAKELFAGLVYRRVLRRLQDSIAERLAYPGLVLRYVTVDLIRNVLGPALNLPTFDEASATKAFAVLASCNWLVSREQDEVWHRRDLRRSTLKAMMAAEQDNARKISQKAIEYFQKKTDPRSQAEAVYHRLLWMENPEQGNAFQLAELKRANDYIKANVGDLPPAAATLLKFAVEGKVPSTEYDCLPKAYLDYGYGTAGTDLVTHRLFGKALRLFERQRAGSPIPDSSSLSDWEVDTLFATASWERLKFPERDKQLSKQPNLKWIGRLLYPLQLIAPERAAEYPLADLFAAATQDEESLYVALRGAEGQEMLRRLVISMIYAAGQPQTPLDFSVYRISQYRSNADRQPFPPVTERRIALLQCVVMGGPTDLSFSINNLQLNRNWITQFREYFSRNIGAATNPDELLGLAQDLTGALSQPPHKDATVRAVLANVDSLSKEEGIKRGTTLQLDPNNTSAEEAWVYLRGPSPEFRDPCRFALLEAFPNRASLRTLGELFAKIIALDTPDLQPDTFAEIIAANPEQALAPYVEFVDRVWALGDLMSLANKKASSPKLERVSTAFDSWNEAVAATINRGFHQRLIESSQS